MNKFINLLGLRCADITCDNELYFGYQKYEEQKYHVFAKISFLFETIIEINVRKDFYAKVEHPISNDDKIIMSELECTLKEYIQARFDSVDKKFVPFTGLDMAPT